MTKIVLPIRTFEQLEDVSFSPGAGTDGQVLFYDHSIGKFTGDNGLTYDKTVEELTLNGGVITPVIKPASDSVVAIRITDSIGGSNILNIDTINLRLGLKGTPGATFDVWGTNGATEMMFRNSNVDNYQVVRIGTDGNGSGLLDLYDKDQVHCARLYAWDDRADTWFKSRYFGIGTSSPGEKLEVNGNVLADGYIGTFLRPESDSTSALQLQDSGGTSIVTIDTTNSRVGIGGTPISAQLNVNSTDAATIGQIIKLSASHTADSFQITNSSDVVQFAIDSNGRDFILDTTTGTKIGTSTTQKMGFYNATPVVQQNGTGETTGFTAGAGTGVNDDSTFTGNVGATAYRISDVVKALKNYGLLAQ